MKNFFKCLLGVLVLFLFASCASRRESVTEQTGVSVRQVAERDTVRIVSLNHHAEVLHDTVTELRYMRGDTVVVTKIKYRQRNAYTNRIRDDTRVSRRDTVYLQRETLVKSKRTTHDNLARNVLSILLLIIICAGCLTLYLKK